MHPGVKIYPFKTVEHGAIVNSSIVWESRGARNLFGRTGVSGLANVDISPELAVRLAMAFATTLPRGATVTVSRDTSRAARMLKQSVVAGLNASGVDVADLEVATAPLTRFGARSEPQRRRRYGTAVRRGRPVRHDRLFRCARAQISPRRVQRKVETDFLPRGLPALSGF